LGRSPPVLKVTSNHTSTKMEDVLLAECSDDEELSRCGLSYGHNWSPKIEELEVLYQRIKNEKVLELQWKCPGRRNPNEEQKVSEESQKPVVEAMDASDAYDFEFDDDAGPVPQKLTPKSATPKSTTKKRTTLAGIVANMERHKIMDKIGADSTPASSKQSGSSNN